MQNKWYNGKWNIFGNADENPSPNYLPDKSTWVRTLAWWARNPLHNFFFHWVGVAGRVVEWEGPFLEEGAGIAVRWIYTKNLKLPCLSYRGRYVEWYVGWRRNGGLGLSLRKSKSKLDSGQTPD